MQFDVVQGGMKLVFRLHGRKEFAKLGPFCAFGLYLPSCITCLRAFVPYAASCLRALGGFVLYVPSLFSCLFLYVP